MFTKFVDQLRGCHGFEVSTYTVIMCKYWSSHRKYHGAEPLFITNAQINEKVET